jgi:hypothetical protein
VSENTMRAIDRIIDFVLGMIVGVALFIIFAR